MRNSRISARSPLINTLKSNSRRTYQALRHKATVSRTYHTVFFLYLGIHGHALPIVLTLQDCHCMFLSDRRIRKIIVSGIVMWDRLYVLQCVCERDLSWLQRWLLWFHLCVYWHVVSMHMYFYVCIGDNRPLTQILFFTAPTVQSLQPPSHVKINFHKKNTLHPFSLTPAAFQSTRHSVITPFVYHRKSDLLGREKLLCIQM